MGIVGKVLVETIGDSAVLRRKDGFPSDEGTPEPQSPAPEHLVIHTLQAMHGWHENRAKIALLGLGALGQQI